MSSTWPSGWQLADSTEEYMITVRLRRFLKSDEVARCITLLVVLLCFGVAGHLICNWQHRNITCY